jgi:hypothetical protein
MKCMDYAKTLWTKYRTESETVTLEPWMCYGTVSQLTLGGAFRVHS